jgi:hypothetical protein
LSNRPLGGILLLGALTILWGGNWPAMKLALRELDPWTFRTVCLLVGGDGLLALQRETSVVRATGRVTPSIDTEVRLTLALFGLDAGGRIVSRGTTYLRSEFGSRSIPFAVELTPTGREADFELRILNYHVPGVRTN